MSCIMVVEDNEDSRYLLEVLLKGHAFTTVLATQGEEALSLARQNPPDLIISDILMPVMDGFTLCRQWKSDDRLKDIPFVFYTATYTDPKDEEFALSLGAERFIVKPEDPDVLLNSLREVLASRTVIVVPAEQPLETELEFFRQYNEVLFRKLEKKMTDMEKSNQALEREIVERKKAEDKNKRLNDDLCVRNEQLWFANKELESFIYSVAHDLRGPLRAIYGFSEIMMKDTADKLDAKGKQYLSRIHHGTEKMSCLIDDLLTLSSTSRHEIQRKEVNLSAIAASIIAELRKAQPGRSVEADIEGGLTAFADSGLIEIVLSNLLGNAWKFTAKTDQARIEFRTGKLDSKIIYYVRDNGVGYNQKYSGKMFWPFHRLHSDSEFEGTGIGLAIVERIIRLHGGKVWAEGIEGKGATIYFSLT